MVARSTKEEAQATRHRLLDAAERLFHRNGVSQTSLQQIATEAGATRGAIYWHFKDKADLFNAMMERVTLPLEQSLQQVATNGVDPLVGLKYSLRNALVQMRDDAQLRRVVEIAVQKVEYVDELHAVRARHLAVRDQCVGDIGRALRLAARQRGQRLRLPAAVAAAGLHATIDGLIFNWLLDTTAFDLPTLGEQMLELHLVGLGLRDSAPRNK
ncbi:TetR family transcriptional regulator [Pseudorhodoferax aquiterrae]|uniref:TetR family transcriptional regulator n=1 Tax=Pseudorhodoferax aquiterrae TaxID=747304 RepID=A0ABQ3G7M1_9BURK|nr:TetR family transcriptional regulator [Pseudorhodoferax aquiterrae]GHC95162.1 TetR family transcriptional regulator [Pseudorhodoferax aquiterrae]